MKFAAASEHRDFFRKHQLIEFDDLLNQQQLNTLQSSINTVLANRLKIHASVLEEKKPLELFSAGRDLWRGSDAIKNIVLSKRLAEISSELFEHQPLRIGYDQLFVPGALNATHTLEELSCLQGIVGGVMLCLIGQEVLPKTASPQIFSDKAGSGIFFTAKTTIDFSQLSHHPDQRYLLITYTHATSVYILNERDPNLHYLKQVGYNFGDKLSEKLHPIVFR